MLQSDSVDGGYSSVAEHRSVDPGVVGSIPTSRPKLALVCLYTPETSKPREIE
jgi:hypothetical protein